MATNLALDDRLINNAVKLGGHKTKRAAVTAALEEYIKSKRRRGILDLFGKIKFDPAWDYKAARRRGNKRVPKG
jgi:Arc/MetJ family transcription regulator